MIKKFVPSTVVEKVSDIDIDLLKEKGIKGLIFDIDNTIVAHYVDVMDEEVSSWMKGLKERGFKLAIISNGAKERVDKFKNILDVYAVHEASKPRMKPFLDTINYLGLKPKETAVVGDQIFTDIYGGNKLGMFTILVKPIDKNEAYFVRIKRPAERIVLFINSVLERGK